MRAQWSLVSLLGTAALGIVFGTPVAAVAGPGFVDGCVTARCVPAEYGPGRTAGGFNEGGYRPGQTFTPLFTGVLREIRVGLWGPGDLNAIAEIRPTLNGAPTNVVLAEAVVTGAPYAGDQLYVANFAPRALVLAQGVKYALTLRAPGPTIPIAALADFPACSPSSGTGDFVTTDDYGEHWSIYFQRDRSFVYEICSDAATPTATSTWGRLKTIYR